MQQSSLPLLDDCPARLHHFLRSLRFKLRYIVLLMVEVLRTKPLSAEDRYTQELLSYRYEQLVATLNLFP